MNLEAVRSLLTEHLGDALVGAFIYGSVAAGRAGPDSDIDCFVITTDDIGGPRRTRLGTAFGELQRALGFTPDTDYPIEAFSAKACQAVLQGTDLDRMLAAAGASGMDRSAAECDEVEVLRALLDQRIVVRHAEVMEVLTTQAHAVLRRCPIEPAKLRRVLGLLDSPPVRQ